MCWRRYIQYIPWLKLGGEPNWLCLQERDPYPYWYQVEEAEQILKKVGFKVVAVGSGYQIKQVRMPESIETLASERLQ